MERYRTMARPSRRTAPRSTELELLPDRAFVLHLDAGARPPRHVAGRIEHITSGAVARFRSLRELWAFLEEVLRGQAAGEQEPVPSARRGRKGKGES